MFRRSPISTRPDTLWPVRTRSRACVSWSHHADFLEQLDGLGPVSDQIFIVVRDRLTCSGGAISAHLAAYLVEKHVGRAQSRKSLHIMIIDDALRAEKPQQIGRASCRERVCQYV